MLTLHQLLLHGSALREQLNNGVAPVGAAYERTLRGHLGERRRDFSRLPRDLR